MSFASVPSFPLASIKVVASSWPLRCSLLRLLPWGRRPRRLRRPRGSMLLISHSESVYTVSNSRTMSSSSFPTPATVSGPLGFFASGKRAQTLLSQVRLPQPILGRGAKVVPIALDQILRFYKCYNVTIHGIQIINSPQCRLKFDNSIGIRIRNISISSPKDSPNTDGIHLQNTYDVEVEHSDIGCGDDCVSIQTGCSNVHIHHIRCSPGHGISVGGLGRGNSLACVSNISVENIVVQNALSGVRIKTWQGGIGSVKNVSFSNVRVDHVDTPIVIDQYY